MAVSIRFYIFASNGMQRISQRLMEGLCHGHDAMPQFAGTKQKMANAIIELEHGKPARIVQVEGSYLQFDQAGKVHEFLQRGAIEAMEMLPSLERSERIKPSKVVDIAPKLKREKWERENRWTPAKEDLDLIADDIFNRKRVTSHDVKTAKGVAQKPPPQLRFRPRHVFRRDRHVRLCDGCDQDRGAARQRWPVAALHRIHAGLARCHRCANRRYPQRSIPGRLAHAGGPVPSNEPMER